MLKIFILSLLALNLYSQSHYKELQDKKTYLSAITTCKDLGDKWRLPQIWEIFALKGETKTFGKDKRYWSATSLVENRKVLIHTSSDESYVKDRDIPAFAFYLQDGDVTPTPKSIKANVICTNLPKTKQSQKWFKKTTKGVEDSLNSILWEPITKSNRYIKLSHEESWEKCESKSLYGKSWRLPTLDELYSIVNYQHVKPSLNTEIFSKMQNRYYWSDDAFSETQAYVVGFSIGSVATSKKENKSYFRCVSDLD